AAPAALLALAAIDAVALGLAWLITQVGLGLLASGAHAQAKLAQPVLMMALGWRIYMMIFRIWLRPELPAARLAPADDRGATMIYRCLGVVIVLPFIGRVWIRFLIAIDTPDAAVAAMALINAAIIGPGLLATVVIGRTAGAALLSALVGEHGWGRQLKLALARHWWIGGVAFYIAAPAAAIYGALSNRFEVSIGLFITQSFLIWWLIFETLMNCLGRHARPAPGVSNVNSVAPGLLDVALRCVLLAARLFVLQVIARAWAVDVLGLLSREEWQQLGRQLASSGIALFLAYVIWQIVKHNIDGYIAANPVAGGDTDGESESEPPSTASRLRTLMPLLRVVAAGLIGVLTVLTVLSELGVSTAPLIAGASIVGLAISFGSQSLVRDIVSGIFYLADDAFRVGEYIDTGKQKGTVEDFTLRSIKLRHQNGQVHTIPFGQLGLVTNFSRDWTTVKFNLRLARGTDVELLRKTAKKIGQEMMADPEFKNEMLQPLKMQGIADITESALVVRFKFTCRPIKPSYIQRQAVKKMYEVFPSKGLEFAQSTVSVQTLGQMGEAAALAAGGGAQTSVQPQAAAGS
ncbi:MAG: mechanosensitive ion channel, partial [Alphaproteobacteria bacterium]|nr:mechanosensitive ion channel [Alphaproteobacteria bacterium]